jgi:glycosyltransferase involved in cell wall biosynthesis
MVAIPNHHFFQWVNQLKESGYEVCWFDVTDGGPKSSKIEWVKQIKGWKLKWDFPFRVRIKKRFPRLYQFIQKFNENKVETAFQKVYNNFKPDIVHCFEMQLSGLPILTVMEQNKTPFVYSSWGSDVFCFEELGVSKLQLKQFYKRVNYLITDCERDYQLTKQNGYTNQFLGVFPGNGGISIDASKIKSASERNTILIKGYDDGVGKASIVLKALETIPNKVLIDKDIVVYSADDSLQQQINRSKTLSSLSITIHSRYNFIENIKLLELMGESCVHIANSISDGIPNALLEAMSMGAFPIQSNPGLVTEEVITHDKNGFLIQNPLKIEEIALHITNALYDKELRASAQEFNVNYIYKQYNRTKLQPQIETLYQTIYKEHQ